MAGMQQGIVWPHGMMTAPALINGTMLNHMPSAMMPQGKFTGFEFKIRKYHFFKNFVSSVISRKSDKFLSDHVILRYFSEFIQSDLSTLLSRSNLVLVNRPGHL